MTSMNLQLEQSLEILIEELAANDDMRDAFYRNPDRTLRQASDWGMPLTESEVLALRTHRFPVWERVADALAERLALAA